MEPYEQPDIFRTAPERERRPDEPEFGQRIAALGLLQDLAKRGYVVRLNRDQVNVAPRPDDATVAELVKNKAAIVALLAERRP